VTLFKEYSLVISLLKKFRKRSFVEIGHGKYLIKFTVPNRDIIDNTFLESNFKYMCLRMMDEICNKIQPKKNMF